MTAKTITQLTALAAADAASADVLPIVDVSDTTMAATGTTKKITLTNLQSAPVSAGTANGVLYLNDSKVATSGSGLVFDGQNLGLGVTPSAWGSGFKVIESGGTGKQSGLVFYVSADRTRLFSNQYWDGAANWVYKNTAAAGAYEIQSNAHVWFTAASGIAGNAISFTQAMTLDASGNLLVGTTSLGGAQGLSIRPNGSNGAASLYFNKTTTGASFAVEFRYNAIASGSISYSDTATAYNTSSDYRLKNITGPVTNSGAYIDSLNPVEGTWKADGSPFVGLIAHEVQEVSRTQVATGEKDGAEMQAMDYSNSELIANLIAEVKSLRARVAALEA